MTPDFRARAEEVMLLSIVKRNTAEQIESALKKMYNEGYSQGINREPGSKCGETG